MLAVMSTEVFGIILPVMARRKWFCSWYARGGSKCRYEVPMAICKLIL